MTDGHKILVVEDNDFVRMQIVTFLTGDGYRIIESTDGDDAFRKLKENRDIVISIVDVRMEPKGGFDFIRAMEGADIKMPVILVTGDKDPELLADAAKLHVSAVLMKPVERDRLLKTVERIIRNTVRAS